MSVQKIYMISNGPLKYIGSTKLPLNIRLRQHFYNYNNWKNNKYCYTSVFDLFNDNNDNVIIELLYQEDCERKDLRKAEGTFINLYKNNGCVNRKNEGVILDAEYFKQAYKKHEVKIKANRKIRDAKNRLILNEKKRLYRLKKKNESILYTDIINNECY